MSTLISAGLVIPGGGATPIRDGAIRIDDEGRIEWLGRLTDLETDPRRPFERRIEAPGGTVLPGLVNAHDHLRDPRPDPSPESRGRELAAQVILGVSAAARHLAAGVTAVRTLGALAALDLAIRDAIADGTIDGPRLVCAGRALTTQPGSPYSTPVIDAESAIVAAEAELDAGADVLKVFASRGVSATDQGGHPFDQLMSSDFMRVVVERAASRRVPVAAHAHGRVAIDAALDAGVRSIEHGVGLEADQARRMAREAIAYVPTVSTYRRLARFGASWGLPATWVRTAQDLADAQVAAVRNAAEAGVTIATGTDSFGDLIEEVGILAEIGLGPLEAIACATSAGADVLGLADEAGALVPGRPADLIVVDGDPSATPARLRDVRWVMARGRIRSAAEPARPDQRGAPIG